MSVASMHPAEGDDSYVLKQRAQSNKPSEFLFF